MEQRMDEVRVNEILGKYKEMVGNVCEALREAKMPEPMIVFHTLNLPDPKKLLPEQLTKFYQEVKVMVILYLHDLGFSNLEIARRIGGHSNMVVNSILTEYRPKVKNLEKKQ